MYWNVTQLYFFMLTTAFGFVCFFFHSPQLCASHPRPKWYVVVGCVYLFKFLNGFFSTSCPIHKKVETARAALYRLLWPSFHSEQAYSSTTSFTWTRTLDEPKTLRPEAFCFNPVASIWMLESSCRGRRISLAHIPTLSSETSSLKTNADGMRDNFLRKWIFQLFYGFLLGEGGVSVKRGQQLPPNCVQFKSIARFLRVEIYFWGSRHPQCSVKILSCTFAFSTYIWFSTSFFPPCT